MKNLMKWCKLLVITLISFFGTSMLVNAATNAPSSIKMGEHTSFSDYIGTISTSYKKTSDGAFIYCTEYLKIAPTTGTTLNKSTIMDSGIAYIISNGYPTKNFTGDSYKDYYITQLAMWWYIDVINGKTTAGLEKLEDGKTYKSNSIYSYIVNLKNGAVNASKKGYNKPDMTVQLNSDVMTLDTTGKYYVSKPIGITASNISGNYNVTLENAPKGTFVVNSSDAKATSYTQGSKFIVKVPVSSINDLSNSFSVKLSATGSVSKAQLYSVNNSEVQKVVVAKLYPETSNVVKSTTLKVTTDKVIINKTNSKTGKNIAGAKIAIKNTVTGNVVKEFTTTLTATEITDLPEGTYSLYEVEAPKGYEKTTKIYSFRITNEGEQYKITIPNVELVKTSQVQISKQDITTGKELSGAKLTIKDSNGKVIDTWVSTEETHYLTLEVGKYTLIEETAPEGYQLSTEVITFEVDGSENVIKVVMNNTPIPEEVVEVPKTGVNSIILYTITVIITAVGLGLVYKYGKANK